MAVKKAPVKKVPKKKPVVKPVPRIEFFEEELDTKALGAVPASVESPVAAEQTTPEVDPIAVAEQKEAALKAAADQALASLKTTETDHEGHSSLDQMAKLNEVQRDFVPGKKRLGPLEIPATAFDEDRNINRKILREDVYCIWVHDDKIHEFKAMGFKFCQYNGGSLSGLAEHGFDGTYLYHPPTLANHVRCADVRLMWAPMRLYHALDAERRARTDAQEAVATSKIHNLGYRHSVRTFTKNQKTGELEYN